MMAAPMFNNNKRETERRRRSPLLSELSDDLLIEIISRVPFKSTCCCKCVSLRWRDLLSSPDHRNKLPSSTLAGFFYKNYDVVSPGRFVSMHTGYQSVSGNWCARTIDTSLSFVSTSKTFNIYLLDCCNGLLLCRHLLRSDDKPVVVYTVCNPATRGKLDVPASSTWSSSSVVLFARLAFDPAAAAADVSSHFHVFEFAAHGDGAQIEAVRIYSSKTGAWTHPVVWDSPISLCSTKGVFFMGLMYLSSFQDFLVAVGTQGNCRAIRVPCSAPIGHDIYQSQGQLYLAKKGDFELLIWALEDSNSSEKNWVLKHNVTHSQLIGTKCSNFADYYKVIAIHPECNNVIFVLCGKGCHGSQMQLMSYEIDSRKLSFVSDIASGCTSPFLPYVPLFLDSLPRGQ